MPISASEVIELDLRLTKEGDSLKVFEEFLNRQPKGKRINPKKVQAFARRIAPLCAPHIVNGLILNVLSSKDPVGYLRRCFEEVGVYATMIEEFISTGHHGMVQMAGDCWPVRLECPAAWLTDGPWHPDDELMILADSCNGWMRDHNAPYFNGRATLFREFGFSGIPREFEMQCTSTVKGLSKVPGTNYYIK